MRALLTGIATLAALMPHIASGQAAEDTTRPTPPSETRPESRVAASRDDAATRGAVKAGMDQELLPALLGLAIATDAETALAAQDRLITAADTGNALSITGFNAVDEATLRRVAAPYLGKPVSLNTLEQLSNRFEEEIRSSSQRLARISFPPQEITSGVVAVRVSPARAGNIGISGKFAFNKPFAAQAFRTRSGDPISSATVLDDLDWLNLNPLRRASISYSDGAGDDQLDLTLRLREKAPWRVYAGIDNQLSESLGDERLFLGYQHGNVLGLDHRFTGQYTAALDFDRLQGLSAAYDIPLPIRHLLQFSAGYTESEAKTLGPIDQSGEFSRVSVTYRVPLPRWGTVSHEWRAGAEFRNNDYSFPNNTGRTVRFFQLETGWKARRKDRFGFSRLDASLAYNPGQGLLGSEDADFIALGADGAESLIARIQAERSWNIGSQAILYGRLRGQWSNSDLLASDQLSAGGMNRVRGFDETIGYASNGLVASIELHSKPIATPNAGDFTGLLFIDAAILDRDAPRDPGQLAAAGLGLRWSLLESYSARIDLAFPLDHPQRIEEDPMLHFGVQCSW